METRIERNKKKKKDKRKGFLKFQLFILCTIVFVFGLILTEDSIRELTCMENQKLFSVVLEENVFHIQLFGKNYVLDFMSFIKNIINIIK